MVVFEGLLKRGPNPLDTYYDVVYIAPFSKTGKNNVAILVCYFGKDGFSHKSTGHAGMIFDCQSPDFELLSDNSWKGSLLKPIKQKVILFLISGYPKQASYLMHQKTLVIFTMLIFLN